MESQKDLQNQNHCIQGNVIKSTNDQQSDTNKETEDIFDQLLNNPEINTPFEDDGNTETTTNVIKPSVTGSESAHHTNDDLRGLQHFIQSFEQKAMQELQALRLDNMKLQQINSSNQTQIQELNKKYQQQEQKYLQQEQKMQELQQYWNSKETSNHNTPNRTQASISQPDGQTEDIFDDQSKTHSDTQYTNKDDSIIARNEYSIFSDTGHENSNISKASTTNLTKNPNVAQPNNIQHLSEAEIVQRKTLQTERLIMNHDNIPVRLKHFQHFGSDKAAMITEILKEAQINSNKVITDFIKSSSGKHDIAIITPVSGANLTTGQILKKLNEAGRHGYWMAEIQINSSHPTVSMNKDIVRNLNTRLTNRFGSLRPNNMQNTESEQTQTNQHAHQIQHTTNLNNPNTIHQERRDRIGQNSPRNRAHNNNYNQSRTLNNSNYATRGYHNGYHRGNQRQEWHQNQNQYNPNWDQSHKNYNQNMNNPYNNQSNFRNNQYPPDPYGNSNYNANNNNRRH